MIVSSLGQEMVLIPFLEEVSMCTTPTAECGLRPIDVASWLGLGPESHAFVTIVINNRHAMGNGNFFFWGGGNNSIANAYSFHSKGLQEVKHLCPQSLFLRIVVTKATTFWHKRPFSPPKHPLGNISLQVETGVTSEISFLSRNLGNCSLAWDRVCRAWR